MTLAAAGRPNCSAAFGPARQEAVEVGLAEVKGKPAQVIVSFDEDVECTELDLLVVLAGMQADNY
jgi:hypothetical protein